MVTRGVTLLNDFGYRLCATRDSMLLYENNAAVLVFPSSLSDSRLQLLLQCSAFGDDCCFRSGGNSGIQGQETCVASHDLHEEETLMACAGIA